MLTPHDRVKPPTRRHGSTHKARNNKWTTPQLFSYLIGRALATAHAGDPLEPRRAASPTSCAERLLAGLLGLGLVQGELCFQVVEQLLRLRIGSTTVSYNTPLVIVRDRDVGCKSMICVANRSSIQSAATTITLDRL
jgi:hypothetical protein